MAGYIPQEFINDLLERADIVALIGDRVPLKPAGKEYKGLCPFHNEKTPSFHVIPKDQFFHCFGCGASGSALKFLMDHDRLEFVEAVEALAEFVGVEVPREAGGRAPAPTNKTALALLEAAASRYQLALKQAPEAIAYLKGRGLTDSVASTFRIGFAPDAWDTLLVEHRGETEALTEAGLITRNDNGRTYDRFRNRIMFPIRDNRGRVLGFGGRVMAADQAPKYLNSPETPLFKKKQELYGLYEARRVEHRLKRVLVVEGYMDVVALAQFGISYAVATLGTASGEQHFQKLYRYTNEVVCCFDGDRAGRAAAWKALESALPTLQDGCALRFLFLPDGEDPDSLVRREGRVVFEERIDQSETALDYLFRHLSADVTLATLEGRARLDSLVRPYLERLPMGVLRRLAEQRLGERTGLGIASGRAGASKVHRREPVATGSARPPVGQLVRGGGSRAETRLRHWLLVLFLAELDSIMAALSAEETEKIKLLVEDPLAQIVSYKERHPTASAGEIVGSYAGEAEQGELVAALHGAPDFASAAVVAEFRDGLARLVALTERARRRKLLAQMDDAADPESLMRYWSLNRNGDPQ